MKSKSEDSTKILKILNCWFIKNWGDQRANKRNSKMWKLVWFFQALFMCSRYPPVLWHPLFWIWTLNHFSTLTWNVTPDGLLSSISLEIIIEVSAVNYWQMRTECWFCFKTELLLKKFKKRVLANEAESVQVLAKICWPNWSFKFKSLFRSANHLWRRISKVWTSWLQRKKWKSFNLVYFFNLPLT